MTISQAEWNDLKEDESYAMYARVHHHVDRFLDILLEDARQMALLRRDIVDLQDRITTLERQLKDHDRYGDICPHTGR